MNRRIMHLTAPSHWAPYLINGDASGLDVDEQLACDAWLEAEGVRDVLDAEDAGFIRWHDAAEFALAANCQTYLCRMAGNPYDI
jgi:hypothetical protein